MKNRRFIFVLIILIGIFLPQRFDFTAAMTGSSPETEYAAEAETNFDAQSQTEPAFVSTGPELIEWMNSHRNTGGEVRLTDNVVLDGSHTFATDVVTEAAISIDTDQYTITVSGEVELFSNYHLTIFGEAGDKGIFYVAEGGLLTLCGVAVKGSPCALRQEEGAGLVLDNCRVSGSVHYADTPFVIYEYTPCVIVEKGQTAADVLPTELRCEVNRQGQVYRNEKLPVSWMLEGTKQQQQERLRFQVQGSFHGVAFGKPPVCTVVYNDYPLTFTEVWAYKNEHTYMFRGWYTKPEEALPIVVATEYSVDEINWFVDDVQLVSGLNDGFFISLAEEKWDTAKYPYIYIRLQWRDHETRRYSNVLRYAADQLEIAEDQGGARGGGTSITNPPDQPVNTNPSTDGVDNVNSNTGGAGNSNPAGPESDHTEYVDPGSQNAANEDYVDSNGPDTGSAGNHIPVTGGTDHLDSSGADTDDTKYVSPDASKTDLADNSNSGSSNIGNSETDGIEYANSSSPENDNADPLTPNGSKISNSNNSDEKGENSGDSKTGSTGHISSRGNRPDNPKNVAASRGKGVAVVIGMAVLSVGAGLTGYCVYTEVFRKLFRAVKRRLVR